MHGRRPWRAVHGGEIRTHPLKKKGPLMSLLCAACLKTKQRHRQRHVSRKSADFKRRAGGSALWLCMACPRAARRPGQGSRNGGNAGNRAERSRTSGDGSPESTARRAACWVAVAAGLAAVAAVAALAVVAAVAEFSPSRRTPLGGSLAAGFAGRAGAPWSWCSSWCRRAPRHSTAGAPHRRRSSPGVSQEWGGCP